MEDIKAVDVMNYPFTAEGVKGWQASEFQVMARTIFKGRQSIDFPGETPAQFVAEMDEAGYDKVFICGTYMFSHRDKKLIWEHPVGTIYEAIKDFPDRLIGIAGYNPLRIEESLRDIEGVQGTASRAQHKG